MAQWLIPLVVFIVVGAGCPYNISAGEIRATGKRTPMSDYNGPQDNPTYVQDDYLLKRQPVVDEAKKSYPKARTRFLSGLPKGYRFFVTVDLHEGNVIENAYVTVRKINGGNIKGIISTKLQEIKSYRYGQEVILPESDIIDWTITSSEGKEEGNYIGKFADEYNRAHQ